MVVGITGGIGSGKSTIVKFFMKLGNIAYYHADAEAKKLMNSSAIIQTKIIALFGKNAYADGSLNTKYISEIVFNNANKLKELNAVVHPEVKKHFQNFIDQHQQKDYILYENAILFETKSNLKCDVVISVFCDLETRILRIQKRDNSSKSTIENKIKNQWKEEKKLLQSNYIITNYSLTDSEKQVNHIHNILTEKAILI